MRRGEPCALYREPRRPSRSAGLTTSLQIVPPIPADLSLRQSLGLGDTAGRTGGCAPCRARYSTAQARESSRRRSVVGGRLRLNCASCHMKRFYYKQHLVPDFYLPNQFLEYMRHSRRTGWGRVPPPTQWRHRTVDSTGSLRTAHCQLRSRGRRETDVNAATTPYRLDDPHHWHSAFIDMTSENQLLTDQILDAL